jgi:hypothetical protein
MKRSEAIKLIYDTMQDNHFGQYGEFNKMSEQILEILEEYEIVDKSKFGATCSRCDTKGWDSENE